MSYPSQSEEWRRVRKAEDLLALVEAVDDRRKVIRAQAWNQGSWEQVLEEATLMRGDVGRLREAVRAVWGELYGVVNTDSRTGTDRDGDTTTD